MLNRKLMFSLVALIGFGLFFTLNAFKSMKKTTVHYQYTSNSSSPTDLHNIANWEEVDGSMPNCGTSGSLVCRYDFDGEIDAFDEFLEDKTSEYLTLHSVSTKQ
jgi:hypothetical protein